METGTKIKELREKARLTQEELAEKVGVQRNTVWRWENQQANLTSKNINKLSEIFNVSPSDFISEEEDENIMRENGLLSPLGCSFENSPTFNKKVFYYECNGQKVEIPAERDFIGLFLEITRDMRLNSSVTVNNNAEAHDNAQAVAVGDGIKA